jgi:anthranilate phosphoribosyltransferase
MVVSADDGLDEISIASRTRVIEVTDRTEEHYVAPIDFGLDMAELDDVGGGTTETERRRIPGRAGRRARPSPRSRST